MAADPTTQSNYLSISTDHVAFDWRIDFPSKIISGSALHTLQVNEDGVREVMSVSPMKYETTVIEFSLQI